MATTLPSNYAAALKSPHTTAETVEAINASAERVSAIPEEIRDRLSFREAEVLACLADGTLPTNEQIGARLSISRHTVNSHFKSIYRSLGVPGRREAVLATLRARDTPSEKSWTKAYRAELNGSQ